MKERPTEPVTLTLRDGRERTLRYPLAKVRAAKKEFGASLLNGSGLKDLDEDTLPKLVWYGLSSDDPGLTVDMVENLIESADLPYVFERFIWAFTGENPEMQAKTAKNGASQSAVAVIQ